MKPLFAFFLLTSSAFADCNPADVTVSGASLTANGRSLLTIEGVGDVTIRRQGRTVRLIEECDPATARAIRRDLEAKLDGVEGGKLFSIPAWLLY